jgi:hypothetical protein
VPDLAHTFAGSESQLSGPTTVYAFVPAIDFQAYSAVIRTVRLSLFNFGRIAVSPASAAVSCHVISAKGVGQDLGNGNTTANVIDGGLLQGTTTASFTATGISGTVVSLAGTVTFTTNNGVLTVTVAGWFDLATGQFFVSGPVTAATGKLAGATGTISFAGTEVSTGAFTENISGGICADLAP